MDTPAACDDLTLYYRKGKRAFRQGKKRSDNPYTLFNDKGHQWDKGWVDQHNGMLSPKPRRHRRRYEQSKV